MQKKAELEKLYEKIEALRNFVWLQDVPHPTTAEYREFHEKITNILRFIDNELLAEANNE